jgi:hypothetical protein
MRIEARRRKSLVGPDGRSALIVDSSSGENPPGLYRNNETEFSGGAADFLNRGIGNTHARCIVHQQQLPL